LALVVNFNFCFSISFNFELDVIKYQPIAKPQALAAINTDCMKFIRLTIIFLFIFQASFGQTWQDTLSLIDKTFSQYQPENPGCQLSISRDGQIIFSKAWGIAFRTQCSSFYQLNL